MSTNDGFQGVSSCYVFKSQLQEYAQKVGLSTPVYETIKEGPSHEPSFRSTVIVNDVRYDSMPGFFNRKAAEQSAAEVALMELANSAHNNEHISLPVHEKGLCKNLLQQYAQKMNYAIPSYECRKDEALGRAPLFYCTVDIGGIKYIGAAAVTRKEAEIKAARTALLAIQSSPGSAEKPAGNSMYSVIPCKKKSTDLGNNTQESKTAALKPRKCCFKKKPRKKKRAGNRVNNAQGENMGSLESDLDNQAGHDLGRTDDGVIEVMESGGFPGERTVRFQSERSFIGNMEGALLHCSNGDSENVHLLTPNIQPGDLRIPNHSLTPGGDSIVLEDLNKISYVGIVAPMVNDSPLCQGEIESYLDWQLAPIINDYTLFQGELTSD